MDAMTDTRQVCAGCGQAATYAQVHIWKGNQRLYLASKCDRCGHELTPSEMLDRAQRAAADLRRQEPL